MFIIVSVTKTIDSNKGKSTQSTLTSDSSDDSVQLCTDVPRNLSAEAVTNQVDVGHVEGAVASVQVADKLVHLSRHQEGVGHSFVEDLVSSLGPADYYHVERTLRHKKQRRKRG